MKKINFYSLLFVLFISGIALSAVSCTENNLDSDYNGANQELAVKFHVGDAQDEPTRNNATTTRGATASGVKLSDLKGQLLEAQDDKNLDVCFIETTIEGVNPVQKVCVEQLRII